MTSQEIQEAVNKVIEKHVRIAKMMMKHGVSCSIASKDGWTPFGIALKMRKFEFVELFIKTASFAKEPMLMFEFCPDICAPHMITFFKWILEQDKPARDSLNILDKEGFTPFLRMILALNNT